MIIRLLLQWPTIIRPIQNGMYFDQTLSNYEYRSMVRLHYSYHFSMAVAFVIIIIIISLFLLLLL